VISDGAEWKSPAPRHKKMQKEYFNMKILMGMIAYNEELLIEASLKSIYNFIDKGVVIDGSPYGPSNDKTSSIIKKFAPKIEYHSGIFLNKEKQRNEYLKYLKPYIDDDTWEFTVDADEVWKDKDLKIIKNTMEMLPPHITAIHFNHLHFWRDFNHVITGGIWSRNILYRINRLKPNYYYRVHNSLADGKGISLDGRSVFLNNVFCYHGGHAQTWDKEFYRYYYMARRGDYGKKTEQEAIEYGKKQANGWLKGGQKGVVKFPRDLLPEELLEITDEDGVLKALKDKK